MVFIGYSLYDIDIERILFSSPVLKKKTYFVVEKNPPRKLSYILSKYGQVLPVGVDGFAEKISEFEIVNQQEVQFWLDSFEEYQLSDPKESIKDDQILNFILHGSLQKEYIDSAISSEQPKPYLIVRRCIDEIEALLESNNYLAILSDFGNGKSVILQEIMAALSMLGNQVFYLSNPDGDYVTDIEKINSLNKSSVLVIDDYSLSCDVLLHISKFNSDKIKVVFSDRSNNHDRLRKTLIEEKLQFSEINIDILHQEEIVNFVQIIDNLGFWGEKANWIQARKVEHIRDRDRSQISNTLLNLFNSPQIKKRIDLLLSPIINDKEFKATIFSICLLEIINLPRNSSLISEVAGNDLIYKSKLRQDRYFNQLFQIKGNKVISKSSLFSINLINNFFSSSYITDMLLDLAEKYNHLRNNGIIETELFKSVLRFSFAERLLPEKGKLNSLAKYYEELKVRVGWLKYDPHFWLQYGMARMNYGQLDKAQSNLSEAYVLASGKKNYDTYNIDTQQARLYILQAQEENDGKIIWELFQKAHNLLVLLDDDIYKYRQVASYKRFFESKYSSLSGKKKKLFEESVIKMKNSLENSPYFHPDDLYTEYSMSSCYFFLNEILEKIQSDT